MRRVLRLLTIATSLGLPWLASAYPGGTPGYVTDVAPFCSSCHSSVSADQLAGVPEARARAELIENKHIAKIQNPSENSPYAELTAEQRLALIEGIRAIDAASSVRVVAPQQVKAGSTVEVTIEATGGAGPVVGLGLVDSNQRYQSAPAPARGWQVIETPVVRGPDGNPQTDFTDRRAASLAPGITYVNVYGVTTDPAQNQYSNVSVTYRLRAPSLPGTYPLAAAFWYGTEKAAPNGAVESIRGKLPRGGRGSSSGRVAFSEVLQIQVR